MTETARRHLRVKDGTKSVTVCGEALLKGYGAPDFVLYQNSIEKWDGSNDQEDMPPAEKEQPIQFLKEEDFS